MMYYLTLKIRNWLFDKGVLKSEPAEVPTICVGNVTVGGTGKTPHTEMILRMLLQTDEWGARNLAVLSRGYKRESKGFQQVTVESSAAMCGDEPLQIKKKFPAVTVAVDKDRIRGCRFLSDPGRLLSNKRASKRCWNKEFPSADLIVLDDAFQYRALKPSLTIVLVDYNRPVHKDRLMPWGRLRDLKQRLGDADVIIVTKCPSHLDNWDRTSFAYGLGVQDYQTSNCEGHSRSGRRQRVLFTGISYGQSVPVYENSDPRYIYAKKLIMFTGIANDTALRNYLSDFYKIIRHYSFSDHHRYTWSDIHKIMSAVKHNPTAAVATTEKDAQRVLDYSGMPQTVKERLFMIPISVDFLSPLERDVFRDILRSVGR